MLRQHWHKLFSLVWIILQFDWWLRVKLGVCVCDCGSRVQSLLSYHAVKTNIIINEFRVIL
jgi:hypothetical protein